MGDPIAFVSYPSEDEVIATALYKAIRDMPDRKWEPFQDRPCIAGGENINDEIAKALNGTVYFTAIGTDVERRNFDWCGEELGFYRSAHPENRREVCLFDQHIPELFRQRKGYQAQSINHDQEDVLGSPVVKVNNCEFYDYFMDVAQKNLELKVQNLSIGSELKLGQRNLRSSLPWRLLLQLIIELGTSGTRRVVLNS